MNPNLNRAFAALAFAALTFAAGAANARDIPAGGMTVADVAAWLQAGGYQAQIVPDKNGGMAHIHSGVGGHGFGIYMFDCKGDRCGSLQFSAGYETHGTFDTGKMNAWNRDKRWARGYFDDVNDPWVEMDVDLSPGGTYELLDDELATWATMIKDFTEQYGLQ